MTGGLRRLAILLSGRGSNFESIADAARTGGIPDAEIVAVISDMPEARGLARARDRRLPAYAVDRRKFATRSEHEAQILRLLEEARADLVCLAGYMRVLSPGFVARFRGRILNIHPSLLPKRAVPVLPGDTEESLSERILAEEHRAYPEAIALVLSGCAGKR